MSTVTRYRFDTLIFAVVTGFMTYLLAQTTMAYAFFGEYSTAVLVLLSISSSAFGVLTLIALTECLRPGTFPLREKLFGRYRIQDTEHFRLNILRRRTAKSRVRSAS